MRNLEEILLSVAHGWNDRTVDYLKEVSVEEYTALFKSSNGERLHELIKIGLQFDKLRGASEELLEISMKVKSALEVLGKESRLNSLRVRKYGITL